MTPFASFELSSELRIRPDAFLSLVKTMHSFLKLIFRTVLVNRAPELLAKNFIFTVHISNNAKYISIFQALSEY